MSSNKMKKKKNKEDRRIVLLLSTIVVLVLSLIGTVFTDWNKVVKNKKETADLKEKYELLLEEEASLNSEVVKLQDPSYVARYAREKYLYSKEGETILRIVESNDSEDKEVSEESSEVEG